MTETIAKVVRKTYLCAHIMTPMNSREWHESFSTRNKRMKNL